MSDRKDIEEVGTLSPFGPNTEKSIISLVFENPDFYMTISKHLSHKYFRLTETKFVMGIIEKLMEETGSVPTQAIVRDRAIKELSIDDDYEPILAIIDREMDRRELTFVKNELLNWAKDRAFGMIYSEEAIQAYESHDYQKLEDLFESAKRITDVTDNGMSFFEDLNLLFDRENRDVMTTGFPKIDGFIEGGGPAKGEVLCWMGGTGTGKSILIPHTGLSCMKRGAKVLHITLELSKTKTALRYAGAMSDVEVHRRFEPNLRTQMMAALERVKTACKNGDLKIYEFPPDEISVDHIYQLINQLKKREHWHPDVVTVDYLELMVSRRPSDNKEDYIRQKQVATQLRGVARNEHVFVVTATQTNREDTKTKNAPGDSAGVVGINRVAESFGKMMPMDYVISAAQKTEEYNSDNPQLRLYIAKNRNGQKDKIVPVSINYKTFKMAELAISKVTKK